MLSQIMYRLFLASLGYSDDLDLSELEINLEQQGELERFKEVYQAETKREWDVGKARTMFALSEASRTLHKMHPETFPMADSWAKANVNRADISPGKLADRIVLLMKRRKPGKSLMFVVDEVGQFVARDVQKMLDLQAVVQQLGVKGRGKHWIVVTSQEKLNELVSGLDNRNIELAAPDGPLPAPGAPGAVGHLGGHQPARAGEEFAAPSKPWARCSKRTAARLVQNTRVQSDIRLPDVARQSFVDLYPLLPYQIELIIQIVSGLRTQSGASRHVGGANRTIIKLAQQLLINPQTRLASQDVGALVRLDHVYDLVEGNISSDIRAKIASIPSKVDHPKAQAVAKAVCLLQFVKSVAALGGECGRLPARFRVGQFVPRGGQGRPRRTEEDVADPRGRRRLSDPDPGGRRLEPDPVLDQPAAGRREQALCRSSERLLVADPDVQPRRHEVLQGRTDVQRQGGGVGRHHLQRAIRRRPEPPPRRSPRICASAARTTRRASSGSSRSTRKSATRCGRPSVRSR